MSNTGHIVPPQRGITPIDPDFDPSERAQEEADRAADHPELTTFLKRTTDSIMAKDAEAWERKINEQVTCMAYYDNRQYGAARGGVFIDAKWETGDVRPVDNRYLVQVNKLMTEMMRSHSSVDVTAADPNDSLKVEAAKFAQHRVNQARQRLLKASERERENQSLLLKGITWRYLRYNDKPKRGPKTRRAKKELKQYGQTRTVRACKSCGSPMRPVEGGTAADAYQCINCGGNYESMITLSPKQMEVVTGYEEVTAGCVESRHIDPLMVRIDLNARRNVSESLFLWYHQMVNRCILEDNYRHVRIKGGNGTENIADRYKNELEKGTANSAVESIGTEPDTDTQGGNQLEQCPFDLIWIDPPMYRGVKFKRPQKLLGGRVIPANVPLDKAKDADGNLLFPDGMCVARNVDQILDVYGEDKNLMWLFCVYGIREHALHGTGTTNLIGPQDTRNELKSYLIANMMFNAAPREFLRSGAITGDRLPGLNEVAIVTGVQADKPVAGWGYERVQGSPMPEQAVALMESETGALQEGAGTVSLSSEGTDSEALSTAFGVQTMRDQAVGRMGPNLMLISEMEEEWSYNVLELELMNFSRERFMKMANQAVTAAETDGSITFSLDGIKAFMESDPRVDFNIRTVPESWTPRSPAERKANMAAFMQAAAVFAEKFQHLPTYAAQLIERAAEIFDIDIQIPEWTPTALAAMARIRAYAKTVEVFQKHNAAQLTDETIHAVIVYTPDAMIDKIMDNHVLYREYYKQWWSSDEGRSCPLLLRAVIRTVHEMHRMALVEQGQQKVADELAINQPRMELAAAAAANNQPDPPPVEIPYKDAPEDIKRQQEQQAGYQPSQEGAVDTDGGKANEAVVKAQTQIAVQEHKHQLQMQSEEHKAQLDIDKQAASAQLDEQRAESDHDRDMELEQSRQAHQSGMEGAKIATQTANEAAKRQHEAAQKDKDREAQRKSTPPKK